MSRATGLGLAQKVFTEEPARGHLWDTLVQAMQHPREGEPHRPTELQVRASEPWEPLRPHLDEVGVKLVAVEKLDELDELFALLSERVIGKPRPGLLEMPNVKPEQVAAFYVAAAHFFRHAPWRKLGYETAIRVECDRFTGGPWYAVVMGQSGLAQGLAVYEDRKMLQKMWQGGASTDENTWHSVGLSVIFGEEVDLPLADAEAARRYGWTVARDDAHPWVVHKDRGKSFRRPLAWELELLTACLRTVPQLVERRPQDDPTVEEMTAPLSSGEIKLTLSWEPA
jgi:hypothetical protein